MLALPGVVWKLSDARWFSALVDEAITAAEAQPRQLLPSRLSAIDVETHELYWHHGLLLGDDPDAAPQSVQGETESDTAFLQSVFVLLTEGARTLGTSPIHADDRARLRWQLGALVASITGEFGVAAVLEEAAREGSLSASDEQWLFSVAGAKLARRAYRLGNPIDGFPLHAAMTLLDARAFLRLAAAQTAHDGSLRRRASRIIDRLSLTKAVFFELLAGVFAASTPDEADPVPLWPKVAARQLRALTLTARDRRGARGALVSPRSPALLLRRTSQATRRLLLEQVVLATLLARRWTPAVQELLSDAAADNDIGASELEAMASRAAAFLIAHEKAALALSAPEERTMINLALGSAMDSMHAAAQGIEQEIRETGELGFLLARLAQGERLTAEERARMREQLIDLAKAVPSLAIFAAPGGMLLLPVILKLLPFDLRPSAFQSKPPPAPVPVKLDATGTHR